MPSPDLSAWPTRAEAAKQMRVSIATLDRQIADGGLETALEPREGKRPAVKVNPADVARLTPPSPSVPAFLAPALPPPIAEAGTTVLKLLARVLRQAPAEPARYLTLGEASKLTGLSDRYLRARIKGGTLAAIRDERQWKVKKADLAGL